MTKSIYLFRHGETELNRKGIIQGSGVDAPLNEYGHQQAQAFYDRYKEVPFEVVLTSALQRTHQTVKPFLDQGLPWEQFDSINEMSWGTYEGKSGDPSMREDYRKMIMAWQGGNFDYSIGGGESARDLEHRVAPFIEQLRQRPEKQLLICCHGRTMRFLICMMKGQALTQMEQYKHTNTALYTIDYENDQFHFVLESDTMHLSHLNSEAK